MFKNILLAADGSTHSKRATEKAIFLAKQVEGAEITLVHVVDDLPSTIDLLGETVEEKQPMPVYVKERTAEMEHAILEAGIPLRVKRIFGEPGPAIVREANEGNYDIVVIGSRGLNPFQQFVLGSVSHKVAKRAKCPVLLVK
ncbi:MAG: universal stress protein [Bacillus sp. (in: Bacteria)]|nr:universal stress protein [Bacillus sp. (in: firmicutes)]